MSVDRLKRKLQNAKPMFFRLKLLTIFNLFTYITGCTAKLLVNEEIPFDIYDGYKISSRTSRLLYPRFSSAKIKNCSFVLNSSKILNHLYEHDIPYHLLTTLVFKRRFKNHLLFVQNFSLIRGNNWLPCNHNIFSKITIS